MSKKKKRKKKKIPWNRFIPFHELVVRLFLNFLTHSVFQNENFPKKYIHTYHGLTNPRNMRIIPSVIVYQNCSVRHGCDLISVVPPGHHFGVFRCIHSEPPIGFTKVIKNDSRSVVWTSWKRFMMMCDYYFYFFFVKIKIKIYIPERTMLGEL